MDFVFSLLGLLSVRPRSFCLSFPLPLIHCDFRTFWAQEKPVFRPFSLGSFSKQSDRYLPLFLLCKSSINKATGILFQLLTKDETEDIVRCCKHEFFLQVIRSSSTSVLSRLGKSDRAKGVFIPSRCKMIKTTSQAEKYFLCFCSARGIVFMGL